MAVVNAAVRDALRQAGMTATVIDIAAPSLDRSIAARRGRLLRGLRLRPERRGIAARPKRVSQWCRTPSIIPIAPWRLPRPIGSMSAWRFPTSSSARFTRARRGAAVSVAGGKFRRADRRDAGLRLPCRHHRPDDRGRWRGGYLHRSGRPCRRSQSDRRSPDRARTLAHGQLGECGAVFELRDDRSLLITILPCDRWCREAP